MRIDILIQIILGFRKVIWINELILAHTGLLFRYMACQAYNNIEETTSELWYWKSELLFLGIFHCCSLKYDKRKCVCTCVELLYLSHACTTMIYPLNHGNNTK